MPTYQYQCTDCGEALEVVQAFTDDSLTECPNCGGKLRKLFNAVGIVFKGSGFYRTDSRSGSSSSVSGSSSSSSNDSSSSNTSSTPAASPSTSSSSSGSSSSGSSSGSGTSGSAA
ncbi:MAG: FmdB family zinc ribbon protein [Candidatus Nanopelagicales bacterium]